MFFETTKWTNRSNCYIVVFLVITALRDNDHMRPRSWYGRRFLMAEWKLGNRRTEIGKRDINK